MLSDDDDDHNNNDLVILAKLHDEEEENQFPMAKIRGGGGGGGGGGRHHVINLSVEAKIEGKDSRFGKGFPGAFTLNKGKRLELHWNHTYLFVFDAKVAQNNHPLYFTTSDTGGLGAPGSILTEEKLDEIREALVRNPEGGSFQILPSRDLTIDKSETGLGTNVKTLYYQCAVHPNMGWEMVVVSW